MIKQGSEVEQANRLVNQLAENPENLELPELAEHDVIMLRYAVKLTKEPAKISADDVVQLRGAGFDDCAIHDICNVTAYFAFVNRVADGLGVELED